MRRTLWVAAIIAAGCAGSQRPSTVARPSIQVRHSGPVYFGSVSSAPLSIEIDITNRANVPVTVREVDLSAPSMVQYTIYRTRRTFNETLQPGETRTLQITTTAVTRVSNPSEPLGVRALVRLHAAGASFLEIVHYTLGFP